MSRTFLFLLSVLVVGSAASVGDAQRHQRRASAPAVEEGKVFVKCPILLRDIRDCPNTGCGKPLDENLNRVRNIRKISKSPVDKDFSYLSGLDDSVAGFAIGDTREKLTDMGEGTMLGVVAYALAARHGSRESCNCGLGEPVDTDNHIVPVDEATLDLKAKATSAKPATAKHKAVPARSAKFNTLKRREAQSQTVEFTPRVRLDDLKLAGQGSKR